MFPVFIFFLECFSPNKHQLYLEWKSDKVQGESEYLNFSTFLEILDGVIFIIIMI